MLVQEGTSSDVDATTGGDFCRMGMLEQEGTSAVSVCDYSWALKQGVGAGGEG